MVLTTWARSLRWRCSPPEAQQRTKYVLDVQQVALGYTRTHPAHRQELGMAAVHVGTNLLAVSEGRVCGMPLPRPHQLVLDAWPLSDAIIGQ